jgi:predicted nucleic acid-binding protein
MRLFIDTNVMLDLLGERVPYYDPIAKIATLADQREITMVVSALSYATVFYLLEKHESRETARDKLRKFKIISEVSEVNETIIEKGLNSDFADFEDSLQYYCAVNSKCNMIITRNQKDFKASTIPVISPEEFLLIFKKV